MGQVRSEGNEGFGILYIVGTPIGNLEDMTFRAIRILREAHWIAAEDTRHTRKLLTHFEIDGGRLVSYHEHNKESSGPELVRRMLAGESVALVSDAGMPAISDPGAELVREAAEAGLTIVPVPGPNAALSALVVSGLPTDAFVFLGFLPRDKKPRKLMLDRWKGTEATLIFYEAPHRIEATIRSLREACGGERRAALVRELTKKHEEVFRGTLEECAGHLEAKPPRGEYCLVVAGAGTDERKAAEQHWWQGLTVQEHVKQNEERTASLKDAIKRTAEERGVPKRDIYNLIHGST